MGRCLTALCGLSGACLYLHRWQPCPLSLSPIPDLSPLRQPLDCSLTAPSRGRGNKILPDSGPLLSQIEIGMQTLCHPQVKYFLSSYYALGIALGLGTQVDKTERPYPREAGSHMSENRASEQGGLSLPFLSPWLPTFGYS